MAEHDGLSLYCLRRYGLWRAVKVQPCQGAVSLRYLYFIGFPLADGG